MWKCDSEAKNIFSHESEEILWLSFSVWKVSSVLLKANSPLNQTWTTGQLTRRMKCFLKLKIQFNLKIILQENDPKKDELLDRKIRKVLETNQGNLLNKATELIRSSFADFFKLDTKRNTKPQWSCEHQQLWSEGQAEGLYYHLSKANGASKVKYRQLI